MAPDYSRGRIPSGFCARLEWPGGLFCCSFGFHCDDETPCFDGLHILRPLLMNSWRPAVAHCFLCSSERCILFNFTLHPRWTNMSHWSGPAVWITLQSSRLSRCTDRYPCQVATENRTGAIFAGNFIPQIIASVFVIARIISKAWIRRKWGADDSILCVAWVNILSALSVTGR